MLKEQPASHSCYVQLAEAEALTRDSDPEVAALAKEEVQQLAAKVCTGVREGLMLCFGFVNLRVSSRHHAFFALHGGLHGICRCARWRRAYCCPYCQAGRMRSVMRSLRCVLQAAGGHVCLKQG